MNYRDTLVTCEECDKQFVFTVEKQRQMAERGVEGAISDLPAAARLCDRCAQQAKFGGRLHGRIKWFSPEKGYGFIVQADGSELFLHRSGVPPAGDGNPLPIEEGQEVLYEVLDSPKGPQAVQVRPYSEHAESLAG